MRKGWSIVLVVVMMLFGSWESRVVAYSQGDGTEENPYIIHSPKDLQDMYRDLEAYYELGNDLDMSDVDWIPVGSYGDAFTGGLDGAGYSITNLHLGLHETTIFDEAVLAGGLFGAIGSGAAIMNLGLQYTLDEEAVDTQDRHVMFGGLAALAEGDYDIRITSVWVDGDVHFSTSNTYRYTSVGGIFGEVYMVQDLDLLSFTGDITVDAENTLLSVGGIAGYVENIALNNSRVFDAAITAGRSKVIGSAVGGMLGYAFIDDSYLEDNNMLRKNIVSHTQVVGGESVHAGGMAGVLEDDQNIEYNVVLNLVDDVDVRGGRNFGGFVGYSHFMEYDRNELRNVRVKGCEGCFDVYDPFFDQTYDDYGLGGFSGYSLYNQISRLVISDTDVDASVVTLNLSGGGVSGVAIDNSLRYIDVDAQVKTQGSAGGIAGTSVGNVFQNVFAQGSVEGYTDVGGIVGESAYDTLMQVSFSGAVKGDERVGGLVGSNTDGELNINMATARADITGGDFLGGILGYSSDAARIEWGYFSGTLESTAEGEANVDPITNAVENTIVALVFYDNELYTGKSLLDDVGFPTHAFKDVDSDVAHEFGVVDNFELLNYFFTSPYVNEGYFTLHGGRNFVLFMSEGKIVNIQLSYGRIELDDEDYDNPYVNEVVNWKTLIQPWEVTREGYVFVGWSEDKQGTEMVDLADYTYEQSILYAQWREELPDTGEASNLGLLWLSLGLLGLMISRKPRRGLPD